MGYEITVKTGLLWRYEIISTTENTCAEKSAVRGKFWLKLCKLQIMTDKGPTGGGQSLKTGQRIENNV